MTREEGRVARTEKRNSKFDHEAHEVHEEKKLTTRRQKFSIRNIRNFVLLWLRVFAACANFAPIPN